MALRGVASARAAMGRGWAACIRLDRPAHPIRQSGSSTTAGSSAGTSGGTDAPHTSGPSSSPPPPHSDRDRLIDAILEEVPTHGWSKAAVSSAIERLGWSPASAGLLPRGPASVVDAFIDRCNRELAEHLSAPENAREDLEDVADRAAYAIRFRLEMAEPYHEKWSQALALRARPSSLSAAALSSARLADEIAHYAGYRTTDVSWYTDRSVLLGAYHATELYWITDKSNGRHETWRFLRRGLKGADSLRSRTVQALTNIATLGDATRATVSTVFGSMRR